VWAGVHIRSHVPAVDLELDAVRLGDQCVGGGVAAGDVLDGVVEHEFLDLVVGGDGSLDLGDQVVWRPLLEPLAL